MVWASASDVQLGAEKRTSPSKQGTHGVQARALTLFLGLPNTARRILETPSLLRFPHRTDTSSESRHSSDALPLQ